MGEIMRGGPVMRGWAWGRTHNTGTDTAQKQHSLRPAGHICHIRPPNDTNKRAENPNINTHTKGENQPRTYTYYCTISGGGRQRQRLLRTLHTKKGKLSGEGSGGARACTGGTPFSDENEAPYQPFPLPFPSDLYSAVGAGAAAADFCSFRAALRSLRCADAAESSPEALPALRTMRLADALRLRLRFLSDVDAVEGVASMSRSSSTTGALSAAAAATMACTAFRDSVVFRLGFATAAAVGSASDDAAADAAGYDGVNTVACWARPRYSFTPAALDAATAAAAAGVPTRDDSIHRDLTKNTVPAMTNAVPTNADRPMSMTVEKLALEPELELDEVDVASLTAAWPCTAFVSTWMMFAATTSTSWVFRPRLTGLDRMVDTSAMRRVPDVRYSTVAME